LPEIVFDGCLRFPGEITRPAQLLLCDRTFSEPAAMEIAKSRIVGCLLSPRDFLDFRETASKSPVLSVSDNCTFDFVSPGPEDSFGLDRADV
jgi:hypothetical protein